MEEHAHDGVVHHETASAGAPGDPRDSDIDLSLLVETDHPFHGPEHAALLDAVLTTTLDHWEAEVEPDLGVPFDRSGCGLRCLELERSDAGISRETAGCMGVYKIQRGFDGYVPESIPDCGNTYPLLTIWRRDVDPASPGSP